MPGIRIDVRHAYSEAEEIALMDAAQAALVEAFGTRSGDRNIVLNVHEPHRFMPPGDRDDPDRYTNVSIVAHAGARWRRSGISTVR